jgi:hypothetical protein
MDFRSALGGAWLLAAQDDAEPGTYHALAMWGVNAPGGLVAQIADNQGDMRRFVAPDGWVEGRVAFVRDTVYANVGRYGERFTYERQSDSTFRMTYETMRDTIPWHEGDHVMCGRQRS